MPACRARGRDSPYLSQDERELVALKFEAGLANAEIGTVVGISECERGHAALARVAKLREAMG